MATQHNCVMMKVGQGKVAFMTVVDEEAIPMKFEIQACVAETTTNNFTKPNAQMIVAVGNVVDMTEQLMGEGIAGIFRSDVWSIKKVKTITDLMYGG